jgi:hypothetical protein
MPLFGPKKDAAFDTTNDPTIKGRDYKVFGTDEATSATIYEKKGVKDPKTDNPGVRWYLATVDEAGKFVKLPDKPGKDFVYKLRAVKLKRDNAGKFEKGKTSPKMIGKAHYIIVEEEVSPKNFNFVYLGPDGIYNDPAKTKTEAKAEGPKKTEGEEKDDKSPKDTPPAQAKTVVGGKTRRKRSLSQRIGKSIRKSIRKNIRQRFTRKVKSSRVQKRSSLGQKAWNYPIKYQKVKHYKKI